MLVTPHLQDSKVWGSPLSFPASLGWGFTMKGLEDNPAMGQSVLMVLWENPEQKDNPNNQEVGRLDLYLGT